MPRTSTKPEATPDNPKDVIGSDKLPLHLWPAAATIMGCLGLLDGASKYGRGNWRYAGIRYTVYLDAAKRHLDALLETEEEDKDSDLHHLCHALATLAIIADAMMVGKLIDDRNYNGGAYREFVDKMTPHVARIKAKHADKDPKHWTIQDNES